MDLPESDKKLMQEKKMVRSLSIYETGEREREREREKERRRERERVKVMKPVRVFFLIYKEKIFFVLYKRL